MLIAFYGIICFLFYTHQVIGETSPASCDEDGRWSLEFEYFDVDSEDYVIPNFVEILETATFDKYKLDVLNCEGQKLTEVEAKEDDIWNLRFDVYNENVELLEKCRNCSVTGTLTEFQECMLTVREKMAALLEKGIKEIWQDLTNQKDELEKNQECKS